MELEERPGGITGSLEYNTDLYNDATIERMIGHFRTLLEGIVANPDQRVSELPLLTEAERRQLLVEWNNTSTDYPRDACVHRLFEAQVEQSPEAVAIIFEGKSLTYRELNARANRLAHYLIQHGAGPESLVGISMERSIEMIVALYGNNQGRRRLCAHRSGLRLPIGLPLFSKMPALLLFSPRKHSGRNCNP